jgi:hypothetical protein
MPATELLFAPRSALQPPLRRHGLTAFTGVLAGHRIIVSGPIPEGKTTGRVRYYVIDKETQAVLGSFVLPDAAHGINSFRLIVPLGAPAAAYDAGSFDGEGHFAPANFTIEADEPTGAMGPGEGSR